MSRLETTKLLAPKTVNFAGAGSGGGHDALTGADVAGAMGMDKELSDHARLYRRLKYQLDYSVRRRLENKILIYYVIEFAIDENWQCGTALLPRLARTALAESLSESICPTCNGTAKGRVPKCPECGGAGYKRWTQSALANKLGIHRSVFSRVWRSRYNRILSIIESWDDEINQSLGYIG